MYRVLEPATFCGIRMRNRFIRSAAMDATADDSGEITDLTLKLFEDLATGGVGLIMTCYAFISRQGQPARKMWGIHDDTMIPGLKRVVQTVHRQGAAIAVQLVHCGNRSTYLQDTGQVGLAPSVVGDAQPHRAMTDAEIEGIGDQFACAAVRAREAGFDGVQFHGAHGYLFSQFLSPLSNLRQDRWGGSLQNRVRFHTEMVSRVRAAVGPDFPVFMKFGIRDEAEGGTSLEDGVFALKRMVEAGLDAVEISGGFGSGKLQAVRVLRPDEELPYYRESAARAKREVGIPVALVGGIRTVQTAEEIVQDGDADFISMLRPLVREPGLISRWQAGDLRRATCTSCIKCRDRVRRPEPLACEEELRRHN